MLSTSNFNDQKTINPIDQVHQSLDLCLNNNEIHLKDTILSFIHPQHHLDFCLKCHCLDTVDPWVRVCDICSLKDAAMCEFKNRVFMYQHLNGRFKGVFPNNPNRFKGKLHSYFDKLTTPDFPTRDFDLIFQF